MVIYQWFTARDDCDRLENDYYYDHMDVHSSSLEEMDKINVSLLKESEDAFEDLQPMAQMRFGVKVSTMSLSF